MLDRLLLADSVRPADAGTAGAAPSHLAGTGGAGSVPWCIGMGLFRYRLRSQLARWVCGGDFTKSKTKFSLEPLSQPVALLSGETVLWYNDQFRQRMLGGQDLLVSRVQKVIPGLDLQQARTQEGQQLTLADGVWCCPQLHRARRCGKRSTLRGLQ